MKAVLLYQYIGAEYGNKKLWKYIRAMQSFYSATYLDLGGFLKLGKSYCKVILKKSDHTVFHISLNNYFP